MPTTDCKEEYSEWKVEDYSKASRDSAWGRDILLSVAREQRAEWSDCVKRRYEPARRVLRLFSWHYRSRPETDTVKKLFEEHAERWKRETLHWSSVTKMIAHPSYLRIIGLATNSTKREITRLLLRELQNEPDHWFAALTAITGQDPVGPEDDFDEAINAWLEWGRQEGIL